MPEEQQALLAVDHRIEMEDYSSHITVMLVEDNASDALITRAAIESAVDYVHVRVISFLNGEKALNWLQEQPSTAELPHIILTDARLPEMSGIEFIRALKDRENLRSIPVFLYSSLINPKDREIALTYGAQEVIEKPLDFYESISLFSRIFSDLFPPPRSGEM